MLDIHAFQKSLDESQKPKTAGEYGKGTFYCAVEEKTGMEEGGSIYTAIVLEHLLDSHLVELSQFADGANLLLNTGLTVLEGNLKKTNPGKWRNGYGGPVRVITKAKKLIVHRSIYMVSKDAEVLEGETIENLKKWAQKQGLAFKIGTSPY